MRFTSSFIDKHISSSTEYRHTSEKTVITQNIMDLHDLGKALEVEKCGAVIQQPDICDKPFLFYHQCPQSARLVDLSHPTVILCSAELLKKLCELSNLRLGQRACWIAQEKTQNYLIATCALGGYVRKSKSSGARSSQSKKIGCKATVRATPLHTNKELRAAENVLKRKLYEHIGNKEDKIGENTNFCVLSSINLAHNGHVLEETGSEQKTLTKVQELLSSYDLCKKLTHFLSIQPGGKGLLVNASIYMEQAAPEIHIPGNILKNAIDRLRGNSYDAQQFVNMLLDDCKNNKKFEFVNYGRDDDSGVLTYAAWAFKGSRSVVQRCKDLVFWDSTHHATCYDYKLSSMNVVDSEGVSRTVFQCIVMQETGKIFQSFLEDWHQAFNCRIPSVIFTDGDAAITNALPSLKYFTSLKHLLCIFHLFDKNVSDKVKSFITFSGFSWPGFRRKLSKCREAISEELFESLWSSLLNEFFSGNKTKTRELRTYMVESLYAKRKQWAVCFFKTSFTLGASSTQRAESFHAQVKASGKNLQLTQMMIRLQKLISRQARKEKRSMSSDYRLKGMELSREMVGSTIFKKLKSSGLSKFACDELSREILPSFPLHVSDISTTKSDNEEITLQGMVSMFPIYSSKYSVGDALSVSLTIDKEMNTQMDCGCMYPSRMLLPCRHIFRLGISVDEKNQPELINIPSIPPGRLLEYITIGSWGQRWKSPYDLTEGGLEQDASGSFCSSSEDCSVSNISVLSFDSETNGAKLKSQKNKTATTVRTETDLDILPSKFPTSVKDGGSRAAYTQLLSEMKALAEVSTKSDLFLKIGRILHDFCCNVTKRLNMIDWKEGSTVPEQNTFHFYKRLLEQELENTLQLEDSSEDNSVSEIETSSHQNAQSLSDNITDKNGVQPETEKEINEKGEEIGEAESQAVKNPPRRKSQKDSNAANSKGFKKRKNREARKFNSRRALQIEKEENPKTGKTEPGIPQFACPFCASIGLQNNEKNVQQHVKAKHPEKGFVSSDQMRAAAISFAKNQSSPSGSLLDTSSTQSGQLNNKSPENATDIPKSKPFLIDSRENISSKTVVGRIWIDDVTPNTYRITSISNVTSGDLLDIFWKQDLKWYRGNVQRVLRNGKVKFLYEDGEIDTLDLSREKFRKINLGISFPPLVFQDPDGYKKLMSLFGKSDNRVILKLTDGRSLNIDRRDAKTLDDRSWLSDGIISCFLSALCHKSANDMDLKFAKLDTQTLGLYKRKEIVENTLNGLDIFDVDFFIWPIHDVNHYLLCIVDVNDRECFLFDPKCPSKIQKGSYSALQKTLQGCISLMTKKYDEKYSVKTKWTFMSPSYIARTYGFPVQPTSNSDDCGVLVCLYAWAFMTGEVIPEQHGAGSDQFFLNMRKKIASLLYSWCI